MIEPTDADIAEAMRLQDYTGSPQIVRTSGVRDGYLTAKRIIAHARTLAKLRVAMEALAQYGHELCELGEAHECCAKLSTVECGGCAARAILAELKGDQ